MECPLCGVDLPRKDHVTAEWRGNRFITCPRAEDDVLYFCDPHRIQTVRLPKGE
jgi:hypothetical protein